MKKILVVVDMQNDFIDGPLGTPEARAIVDNVCAKIREGEWDEIITTQDTHDEMYLKKQEGKYLPIKHCQEGTEGWNLHHKIFSKLINRYFWTDTFKNTFGSLSLVNHLRVDLEKHPELTDADYELTLIGVCTDICVISNALLLKAHYPEMKIVVDAACCAGTTPEKHRMALEVMKSCQVEVENYYEDYVSKEGNDLGKKMDALNENKCEFNQEACDRKYFSSCVIDANCIDTCNMKCPYEAQIRESED